MVIPAAQSSCGSDGPRQGSGPNNQSSCVPSCGSSLGKAQDRRNAQSPCVPSHGSDGPRQSSGPKKRSVFFSTVLWQ